MASFFEEMRKMETEEAEEDWLLAHYPVEVKRRRLKKMGEELKKMEEELEKEGEKRKNAEKEEERKEAEAVRRLDVLIIGIKLELAEAEEVKKEIEVKGEKQ